jgi:hypothetical protein
VSEYPKPTIMIHTAGSKIVMRVDRKTAAKWKRCKHRRLYNFEGTRVYVHSDFGLLTKNQQKEWFKIATEKKNPIVMRIHEAMNNCFKPRK